MRQHLQRVLELTKPYRFRLLLGLACGFLSGLLAFTLPVSLNLAVDAVFPGKVAAAFSPTAPAGPSTPAPQSITNPAPALSINDAPPAEGESTRKKMQRRLMAQMPAPLKDLLNRVNAWFRPSDGPNPSRLVFAIALIPSAMFLRSVLAYLNIYFLSWVGIRAANDLRVRLFQHLMKLPLQFFSRASTGDLMTRIEGALAINLTVKDSFTVIIREPITILVLIGYLVSMQPLLSIYTLLVFPVCLVPIVVFGRKFRKSNKNIHSTFARMSNVMHESFTGIRVIKSYNLEPTVVREFRQATDGVTGFFMRSVRAGELPGPLIEFLGSLGVAMVFVYFGFVATDRSMANASDMLAFFIAVFGLYQPLKNLSRLQHQLTVAKASIDPIYDLLGRQTTVPEPQNPQPLEARGQTIRFADVNFSYGEKPVLQNINLTIKPGQMVALVGRTGSGKTSIINLLLRFYDPQRGGVFIGDTDIRQVASKDLRSQIAIVTQETILFNDTIARNIALGRPEASPAEIEEAAKHAYAHDFILAKPQGYNTLVGEKGVLISGGQRQRIAIARAILRNAPILVLDEATNALDAEAERIVQTALEELMQGRTTICIAHRLSTIQKADMIVVLDFGRIVETGTHEELIKAGGLYRKLYELQFDPCTS
jgi:subfamily B ATP-binding cassette protein MsbA